MGKLHGSLARAGKVRNQTPKLAVCGQRDVPSGRAYKRIIYNKRFMNLDASVTGAKKGPNTHGGRRDLQ